jgi:hypothetical protein
MKLINFRDVYDKGEYKFATVDIESGFLFWKKITAAKITKETWGSFWRFVDSGKYTPNHDAERLYAARCAKKADSGK